MVISEMMAKAYNARVDRNMANIKAYGKTKEARAFARAQTKAEAQDRAKAEDMKKKAKPKRKSKAKAKPKTVPEYVADFEQ